MLVQIVRFTDPTLPVRDRAQRIVSLPNAKLVSSYITENLDSFKFNNIELSIMGQATFEPTSDPNFGYLVWDERIPVLSNDGQTRTKGFELAIALNAAIAREQDVKVAFEVNPSLERCRQVFADLNLNQRKVSEGLSNYYDSRDLESQIARQLIEGLPLLENLSRIDKDSLSKNDPYLFTFNAWKEATSHLLCGQEDRSIEAQTELAANYWSAVAVYIPEWLQVNDQPALAGQMRATTLHSQAVMLDALGQLGAFLIQRYPQNWEAKLETLRQVDWSRSAPAWRGRVIVDGKLSKNRKAEAAALRHIKTSMGLPLSAEEAAAEAALEELLATA